MKDSNEIEKLLRLKKYETPGDDYFEEFAEKFKERQRSELLQHSSRVLLTERASIWLQELGGAKWLLPAGAGVAAMAFISLSMISDSGKNSNVLAEEKPLTEVPEPISFELDLPRPGDRVPGNPSRRFSDSPEKLNTSLGGGRREL